MMRTRHCFRSSLFLSLIALNPFAGADEPPKIVDTITQSGDVIADVAKITQTIAVSCTNGPVSAGEAMNELTNILYGIGDVLAEETILLAMKPDFPQVCHVLTQQHIDTYDQGTHSYKDHPCIVSVGGDCKLRIDIDMEKPKPSYYWPKYFVEVTKKGNDWFEAFAKNNALYVLDRKVSDAVQSLVDPKSASLLMGLAVGKGLLSQICFPNGPCMSHKNASEGSVIADGAKSTALLPYEQMRVRANQQSTQPTYEVGIWPVAMSASFAEHFTVCGQYLKEEGKEPGGYTWPVPLVPMTCPVALSSHAQGLWDTGALDYLDPQSVSQMVAASNPFGCATAAAGSALAEQADTKRSSSAGELGPILSAINGLGSTDKVRNGMRSCSFPILGTSTAFLKLEKL